MKITMTWCLLASLLVGTASAMEDRGCVDSVAADADLFSDKVEALFSEFWDVEYFGTYKIATNKAYDVTYLLYQCGTEVPAEENDGRHEAILEIPLKEIAITVTPMITYMEQLGLEGTITTFLSDISTVASPCFAEAIQLGNITSLNRGDENTSPSLEGQDAPLLTTNTSSPLVTFISGYEQSVPSARPPFAETVVAVADSSEKTNNAIFEWVKFFSVFFNAEKIANEVFEAAQSRFDCVSENAGKTVTDAVDKPKLLWAYYSPYCGGWDVGECPNYYCEYATACSAEILSSSEGTNQFAIEACGATYMTDDEFFAFGKDADYWFFPSPDWTKTLEKYGAEKLQEIKAFNNTEVYDFMGRGDNAWFEYRFAEYYKVVDDLCFTLGVKESFTGRHFWRNVLTESIPNSGVNAVCDESTQDNGIFNDPDTCEPLPSTDPSASAPRSVFFGAVLALAALMQM